MYLRVDQKWLLHLLLWCVQEAAWQLTASKAGEEARYQSVVTGTVSITNSNPVPVTVFGVLTAVNRGPSAITSCGPSVPFQVSWGPSVFCSPLMENQTGLLILPNESCCPLYMVSRRALAYVTTTVTVFLHTVSGVIQPRDTCPAGRLLCLTASVLDTLATAGWYQKTQPKYFRRFASLTNVCLLCHGDTV